MFGRSETVSVQVYADLHERCLRLEAQNAQLGEWLTEALRDLVDASRHAPRGESGRSVRAPSAPRAAPLPPPPDAPAPLGPKVLAVILTYSFGDEATYARTLALAEAWKASGMDDLAIADKIAQGEHRDDAGDEDAA